MLVLDDGVDIGVVVGERVKAQMLAEGYTQDGLAEESGVSQGTISLLINGKTKDPAVGVCLRLAKALGLTLDELIRFDAADYPRQSTPSAGEPMASVPGDEEVDLAAAGLDVEARVATLEQRVAKLERARRSRKPPRAGA